MTLAIQQLNVQLQQFQETVAMILQVVRNELGEASSECHVDHHTRRTDETCGSVVLHTRDDEDTEQECKCERGICRKEAVREGMGAKVCSDS